MWIKRQDGSEIPPLLVLGVIEVLGASLSVDMRPDRLLLIFSSLTAGLPGDSGTD